MHANEIVHCDIKPENILLRPKSINDVRLIDFGSSCLKGHQTYEYIQSRFYRAPEVILGIPYGPPVDIWSFALVIVEMLIGRPVFPGDDEKEQINMYMEVFGAPPRDLIAGASRRRLFFRDDLSVLPLGKNRKSRKVGSSSLKVKSRVSDEDLLDLLSKCLVWDGNRRITAEGALNHRWFREKVPQTSRPKIVLRKRTTGPLLRR
jgi:dual specificity tyrosine-phosphorylation-regulated kinase 2/3/4